MPVRLVLTDRQVECAAVILDKDGTLVDLVALDLSTAHARAQALAEVAGCEAAAAWQQAVGVDLASGWVDRDGPLILAPRRDELLVAATVLYRLGHPWDEARALALAAYDQADRALHPPFGGELLPGVAEALAALRARGLRLAIATTDRRWRAEAQMDALGTAIHFGAIVGIEDVANGKPAPDMVQVACERLGCRPQEAAVVGDSPTDLLMGRAAGAAACIGVTTGLNGADRLGALADAVLPGLSSLPPLVVPSH